MLSEQKLKQLTAEYEASPPTNHVRVLLAHVAEQAERIAELEDDLAFKQELLKVAGVTSHTFTLTSGKTNHELLDFLNTLPGHSNPPKETT